MFASLVEKMKLCFIAGCSVCQDIFVPRDVALFKSIPTLFAEMTDRHGIFGVRSLIYLIHRKERDVVL